MNTFKAAPAMVSGEPGMTLSTPSRSTRRAQRLAIACCALTLGACSLLSPKPKDRPTIYAPDPRVTLDASAPRVDWQLSMTRPLASGLIDGQRIAVRPVPGEIEVYKGASWANRPTDMLEDAVLRALEDSGRIGGVARQGIGVTADYKLVMELRRFESEYAGKAIPSVVIEVNAKLMHAQDQDIVDARTFTTTRPATATDVASVVTAFDGALADTTRDIATWVLVTGHAHDRGNHHAK